jgi:hypothetical protein
VLCRCPARPCPCPCEGACRRSGIGSCSWTGRHPHRRRCARCSVGIRTSRHRLSSDAVGCRARERRPLGARRVGGRRVPLLHRTPLPRPSPSRSFPDGRAWASAVLFFREGGVAQTLFSACTAVALAAHAFYFWRCFLLCVELILNAVLLFIFVEPSAEGGRGEVREAHECVRSMSDLVCMKYSYAIQTLKCDFLVKHLLLIPFAPLRSL